MCIYSFKRPGWKEKHVLKVLALKKILTTQNFSSILKFSTKFEIQ